MERTMEQVLSVSEAFAMLKAGTPLFVASAPEGMDTQGLREAWKDSKGYFHSDLCAFYTRIEDAMTVARLYGQDCILCLFPAPSGNGRAYLVKDLIRNRVSAIREAGGYIADGEHLLITRLGDEPLSEMEVEDSLPADLVLTFAVQGT
jgi:hypothetical protein